MSPIKVDPEILGGTPCFAGTRVPVRDLFELFERDCNIDYFLNAFPTVSREQVLAVLELARDSILHVPVQAA